MLRVEKPSETFQKDASPLQAETMWVNNVEFSCGQSSLVGMGQRGLAVSQAAATLCLPTMGRAWRGGKGSPAEGMVWVFFVGL